MSEDLVKRLRDGLIEHQKRWSGDTHDDMGGSVDYDATDDLLEEAAARIEALQAERGELAEAIDSAEIVSGPTSNGSMWRFWAKKARDLASKNKTAETERDAAVLAEREACAQTVEGAAVIIAPESVSQRVGADSLRQQYAYVIRARSNKEPKCPDCDLPNPDSNPYCFCKSEPEQWTHEQRTQFKMVSMRVRTMRQGGQPHETIRAGLIAEGWPIAAVGMAMEAYEMTRPGDVEHET